MALVFNVLKGGDPKRLLLLVHGYGADERDLGALVPYLDDDDTFLTVLPRAPIAAAGTPGFMWFEFDDGGVRVGEVAALAGTFGDLCLSGHNIGCAEHERYR